MAELSHEACSLHGPLASDLSDRSARLEPTTSSSRSTPDSSLTHVALVARQRTSIRTRARRSGRVRQRCHAVGHAASRRTLVGWGWACPRHDGWRDGTASIPESERPAGGTSGLGAPLRQAGRAGRCRSPTAGSPPGGGDGARIAGSIGQARRSRHGSVRTCATGSDRSAAARAGPKLHTSTGVYDQGKLLPLAACGLWKHFGVLFNDPG